MCAPLIDGAKARTSGRKRVEAGINRQPRPGESLEEVLRKEDEAIRRVDCKSCLNQ
jgi:hypothetical protein